MNAQTIGVCAVILYSAAILIVVIVKKLLSLTDDGQLTDRRRS